MVDPWILLGVSWRPSFDTGCTPTILVIPYIYTIWLLYKCFWLTFFTSGCVFQALHSFPGIRCVLCPLLCCSGMCHWPSCLLLPTLYHCNSLCCCRSGITSNDKLFYVNILTSEVIFVFKWVSFLCSIMANAIYSWLFSVPLSSCFLFTLLFWLNKGILLANMSKISTVSWMLNATICQCIDSIKELS